MSRQSFRTLTYAYFGLHSCCVIYHRSIISLYHRLPSFISKIDGVLASLSLNSFYQITTITMSNWKLMNKTEISIVPYVYWTSSVLNQSLVWSMTPWLWTNICLRKFQLWRHHVITTSINNVWVNGLMLNCNVQHVESHYQRFDSLIFTFFTF